MLFGMASGMTSIKVSKETRDDLNAVAAASGTSVERQIRKWLNDWRAREMALAIAASNQSEDVKIARGAARSVGSVLDAGG
jgi:hypothetical protein